MKKIGSFLIAFGFIAFVVIFKKKSLAELEFHEPSGVGG
jgi:hypothetical protein